MDGGHAFAVPPRVALRAEVAGMNAAEARDYLLDYFDWLFPAPPTYWRLRGVHLCRQESLLLRRLWQAGGALVSYVHLAGAIYGDRLPDDWADSHSVPVLACKLRRKLRPLGVTIRCETRVGYAVITPPGFDWPWEAVL